MTDSSKSVEKRTFVGVSAPGKVILHGEHSVVYGKLALATSLGLRTRVRFDEVEAESCHPSVTLNFPGIGLSHIYNIQKIKDFLKTPIPLIKSPSNFNYTTPDQIDHEALVNIVEEFLKNNTGSQPLDPKQHQALLSFFYLFLGILGSVNIDIKPFTVNAETDLTISAGTGSSASFLVSLTACLIHLIKLKKCQSKDIYKINKFYNNTNELKKFDKSELEFISTWAFQGERIVHGKPSGVDNTICTYGSMVEFRKNSTPKLVQLSVKFTAILINTKIPRNTKALVAKVANLHKDHKKVVALIFDTLDLIATDALSAIKKICEHGGKEGDSVVQEEFGKLETLATMNQHLLASLGVSHTTIDEICQILAQEGLHGKLTGAGGGGYVICVVPPLHRDKVEKAVKILESRGFEAVCTDLGGEGVRVDYSSI